MKLKGAIATAQSAAMYGRGLAAANRFTRVGAATGAMLTGSFDFLRPASWKQGEEKQDEGEQGVEVQPIREEL
jgi:hypothetical protein